MHRREVLLAGLTWPLWSLLGQAQARVAAPGGAPMPFDDETVPGLAKALAARPFQPQTGELPASLQKIGYDQYRGIRFNPAQALWRADGVPFQAQFFHRGFFFRDRVDIFQVVDGKAAPIVYRASQFTFDGTPAPKENDLGYAGLRLHSPINRPDYFDEVAVFLGASYFRAVAKGLAYGLSARGLALKTGSPNEEFPVFRRFWLVKPARGADRVVVHALMDSPSVAGAFRFTIVPGSETVFDVSSRLYPRVALDQAGIAPLTSMFQFDSNDRVGVDDYRPAVHDSDGLGLVNGRGEQIWRPLQNPSTAIQESGFEDVNPRGFGLMQRKRAFVDYADSEAHYEKRPSLWIEPQGEWGEGAVHLIELPTQDEFHDNIVAFWRPKQPLAAGREYRFDYRMHWCEQHSWMPKLATVTRTRIGGIAIAGGGTGGRDQRGRLVVIDFAGGRLEGLGDNARVRADVSAAKGKVANVTAHPNPGAGGWRLAFELLPGDERSIELRAVLGDEQGPLTETWLYRWTL